MTRKITISFYHFVYNNAKRLEVSNENLTLLKENNRFTSHRKLRKVEQMFPFYSTFFEDYLRSAEFKTLIRNADKNNKDDYTKLLFRHAYNFLEIVFSSDAESSGEEKIDEDYSQESYEQMDLSEDSKEDLLGEDKE